VTLVAAAGVARQVAGGPAEADAAVGAALELGLGIDLGARLRLSLTGAYLPDVARPDQVERGLWRVGPALRLFLAGPSRDAGAWLALGGGMGATTAAARPYARADLGWSLGHAAQLGLVVSAIRELDSLEDGGSFLGVALRFDGVLPGPWTPRAPAVVVAASPPRPPAPGTIFPGHAARPRGRPQRRPREPGRLAACIAARRHGGARRPRGDRARHHARRARARGGVAGGATIRTVHRAARAAG
jgi:hypothetical protein